MSRASNHKVNAELFSLEPTALLEFFVIYYDYVNMPNEKLYVHGGTNGINGSVFWQGVEYLPFPIQSSGFETKGDGSLPRPKLTISNQDFFVSNLIRRYNNLIGAKIVRKRTFLKFLDNQNFSESKNPYGSADPTAGLEDQVFFILRRASENRAIVEFELASPLEIDNVTFPKRSIMARYCGFHYRGNGCGYMGPPIADENDMLFRPSSDLRSGLMRRRYAPAVGDTGGASAPANTSQLTAKIAAATYVSGTEQIATTFTPESIENYYYEYIGYFKVDKGQSGEYEFGLDPDDGADLFIDGELKVSEYGEGPWNNNGTPQQASGKFFLNEGFHRFVLRYYQKSTPAIPPAPSASNLKVYYKPPSASSINWIELPSSRLFYDLLEFGKLTSTQRYFSSFEISARISLDQNSETNALNRGLWETNTNYNQGEYIYIENNNIKVAKRNINTIPNWTPLQKFYICVKSHTSSGAKHPSFNREYWICDQCSKTIRGCELRFKTSSHLPFGGFPGTEEYSIST